MAPGHACPDRCPTDRRPPLSCWLTAARSHHHSISASARRDWDSKFRVPPPSSTLREGPCSLASHHPTRRVVRSRTGKHITSSERRQRGIYLRSPVARSDRGACDLQPLRFVSLVPPLAAAAVRRRRRHHRQRPRPPAPPSRCSRFTRSRGSTMRSHLPHSTHVTRSSSSFLEPSRTLLGPLAGGTRRRGDRTRPSYSCTIVNVGSSRVALRERARQALVQVVFPARITSRATTIAGAQRESDRAPTASGSRPVFPFVASHRQARGGAPL